MLKKNDVEKYLEDAKGNLDSSQFQEWLIDPINKVEAYKIMQKAWKDHSLKYHLSTKEKKWILNNLKTHLGIGISRSKTIILNLQRIAAILFLPLVLFTLYYFINQVTYPDKITTYAPAGQQAVVSLPDGSEVILNNCSKIEYDRSFGNKNRNLFLEGEAFFNVAKSEKTFSVTTRKITITALGTKFNVNAYNNNEFASATLEEGSVMVMEEDLGTTILLKPGEQAYYSKQAKKLLVFPVRIPDHTAWKDGKLVFNNAQFIQIARKLERKFGVTIKIETPLLYSDEHRYTGTFSNESLGKILDAIQITTPINYKIEDNIIFINYYE